MKKIALNIESVTKIYLGGDRVCRCGCAGCVIKLGDERVSDCFAHLSTNEQ